jgi:hypothetical protein
MPREATLFESAGGSVLKGYRLLQRGEANIPSMWIRRASESRCRLYKDVAQVLEKSLIDESHHGKVFGHAKLNRL